jgi:hypothetical protein
MAELDAAKVVCDCTLSPVRHLHSCDSRLRWNFANHLFWKGISVMAKKVAKPTNRKTSAPKRREDIERNQEQVTPRADRTDDQISENARTARGTHGSLNEPGYGDRPVERKGIRNDVGSLDEETLSKDAPYNHTYGVQETEK